MIRFKQKFDSGEFDLSGLNCNTLCGLTQKLSNIFSLLLCECRCVCVCTYVCMCVCLYVLCVRVYVCEYVSPTFVCACLFYMHGC